MTVSGEKRKFDHISVEVLDTAVQVMAAQPSARYTDWADMRERMLRAVGQENPAACPDVALSSNELCYIVAKTAHPQKKGTTVCLVEKPRGQGFTLMPESALEATGGEGQVVVEQVGHQFSGWTAMEEKLGVTSSDYKAVVGDVGVIIARAPHLKDNDVEVLAVLIPSQCGPEGRCIVLMKALACKVLPSELVMITDPGDRYNRWPEMADMLGIEEPKPAPILKRGMLGIARGERQHFVMPDVTVVAVELLDMDGKMCMMKKSALKNVKA